MLKESLHNTITGIGFGSFAYLLVLLFKVQATMPTTANILSVLAMSVGIGLVALIFDTDVLPWGVEVAIHFVATLLLVIATMIYNGWLLMPSFWLVFVLIYAFYWAVVRVQQYLRIEKINAAIARRREHLDAR
jgi:uncharacterized membrane protein